MLNRVVLIGRLTKDPELRYTPNGVAVTNFTLAVERNFKNAQGEKETDFFNCSVFKQLAELCSNYLAKGKLASIDGRIQIRTYNDKDGQKHWVTEIIGENVQFLSPKSEDTGAPAQNQTQPPAQNTQPPYSPPPYNAPPTGAPMGAPAQYRQSPGQAPQQQGHLQSGTPQNAPGAGAAGRFGHEVNLDDDIPF